MNSDFAYASTMPLRQTSAILPVLFYSVMAAAEQPDFVDVPTPKEDTGAAIPCTPNGVEIASCEASFRCCSGCCANIGGIIGCVECGAPIPEPESDWGGVVENAEPATEPPEKDHYDSDIASTSDVSGADGDIGAPTLSDATSDGEFKPGGSSDDGGCSASGLAGSSPTGLLGGPGRFAEYALIAGLFVVLGGRWRLRV